MFSTMASFFVLFLSCLAMINSLPNHAKELSEEEMHKMMANSKMIVHKMCMNKTETMPESVMALSKGHFDHVDDKTKCFVHCILKAMEVVKEDDMLDFDAMHMIVDKMMAPNVAAQAKMSVDHCMDAVGKNGCDTAFQFVKCTQMNNKELFAIIF